MMEEDPSVKDESGNIESQLQNRMQEPENIDTELDLVAQLQQLKESNQKLQEQIKQLVKANASWEKYAFDLKTSHEKQITSIMQDIKDERQKTKEYKELDQQRKAAMTTMNNTTEEKIKEAEDERQKAVEHAMNQQRKVDELKVELSKVNQLNTEQQELLEKKEQKITYLQKAVDKLRDKGLSQTQPHQNQIGSHEECRKKLQERDTEIAVLQQQIALFKEDFDSERRDREKAQTAVIKLKDQIKATKGHNTETQNELHQRILEVNALKETRDRQVITIERLERENSDLKRKIERRGGDRYNVHVYGSPIEEGRRHSPVRQNYHGFLTDDQKQQMRRNWEIFCTSLRPDGIVPHLFSEGVLTLYQKQEIDARLTTTQKAEYIMSNVVMKGTQRDLKAFKTALINTYQEALAELVPSFHQPRPQAHVEEAMEVVLPTVPVTPLSTTWRCILCTYENYKHRTTCEMCGTEKTEYLSAGQVMPPTRGVDQCDTSGVGLINRSGDVEEDED